MWSLPRRPDANSPRRGHVKIQCEECASVPRRATSAIAALACEQARRLHLPGRTRSLIIFFIFFIIFFIFFIFFFLRLSGDFDGTQEQTLLGWRSEHGTRPRSSRRSVSDECLDSFADARHPR